jgi:hypothetical protein
MNIKQTYKQYSVWAKVWLKRYGVNLALAVLLAIHAGSMPIYDAYLIGRTPADTATLTLSRTIVVQNDTTQEVEILSSSSAASVFLEEATVEEIHSASASSSIESVSSASSAISREPFFHNAAPVTPTVSDTFPAFDHAVSPVSHVPNWGAMRSPAEWNRSYEQMTEEDFVQVPAYDMRTLMTPLTVLAKTRDDEETIRMITAKLYYSTRYFGAYDLDAGEFSAIHPGIDLKLADGTPVGAMAGGRVHDVRRDERSLGLHVLIEHRAPDGQTYYSIYGHLDETAVKKGDDVTTGQVIGIVGMTGNTSGPHLHLQIDKGEQNETYHTVYWPSAIPTEEQADASVINPVRFIRMYAHPEQ